VVQFGCTGPGQIVVRLADALASQRPGSLSGDSVNDPLITMPGLDRPWRV